MSAPTTPARPLRRVLLTGPTGQLGHALLKSVPPGVAAVGLPRERLDLSRPDTLEAALAGERFDAFVSAGAYTAVDKAETDAGTARAVNAVSPGVLAGLAARQGAAFVQVSTDFVFDGRRGAPYPPDAPTAPLGVYGLTKRDGELAVRAVHPAALVLRTAWVHSAHGTNFVKTMLRLMNARDSLDVVADQTGTPTRAPGVAAAIWAALDRGLGGIHHVTDAGAASWYDFAVAIREDALALGLLGADRAHVRVRPIPARDYPTPAQRPSFSRLDGGSLHAALDLPCTHWRDGLRATLAELKAAAPSPAP